MTTAPIWQQLLAPGLTLLGVGATLWVTDRRDVRKTRTDLKKSRYEKTYDDRRSTYVDFIKVFEISEHKLKTLLNEPAPPIDANTPASQQLTERSDTFVMFLLYASNEVQHEGSQALRVLMLDLADVIEALDQGKPLEKDLAPLEHAKLRMIEAMKKDLGESPVKL